MFSRYRSALLAAFVALGLQSSPALGAEKPVVVELFTSQGCSSCPPADQFLGELAARDGVIALSFHVDYWNYIGWKDPFSERAWTRRQRAYGKKLKRRYVYTPQIVIDGARETVGSKRARIDRLIDAARRRPKLDVTVKHIKGEGLRIDIPALAGYTGAPATIWIALFDSRHSTPVRSGENQGATLVNTNVVRSMKNLGRWRGEAVRIDLSPSQLGAQDRDGCAILVQADGTGRILGAATAYLR